MGLWPTGWPALLLAGLTASVGRQVVARWSAFVAGPGTSRSPGKWFCLRPIDLVAAGYDGGSTGPIASEMSTLGETLGDSRELTIWATMGSVIDAGNWPGSPYTTA